MMLVVWSVILTAGALFAAARHQDGQSFATERAVTVAQLAAKELDNHLQEGRTAGTDDDDAAATWLERVSRWPAVQGAALMRDGQPVAVDAPEPLATTLLAAGTKRQQRAFFWTKTPPVDGRHLAVWVEPIRAESFEGTLVLGLRLSARASGSVIAWQYFVPMAMAGLVGVCIGMLWLSHEVVRPIEMLSKVGADGSLPAELLEPTSASRYAELASLAQTLRCLHVNLDQWRSKADQLERTFDKRVQDETRRINLTLQRTQREIWRDPLTGLYNRRMLEENGDKLMAEQRRDGGDMSLVMFDVDHFKTLNDTLGHMAGDEMLQFVSQLLKQAIRREDFAIRYGGDEFLLLLPGVPETDAQQIAARAVALFGQHTKLLRDLDPKPTLSAGVASMRRTRAGDVATLMQLADSALYQAKRSGKNCVELYDPATARPKPSAGPKQTLVSAGKRVINAMF